MMFSARCVSRSLPLPKPHPARRRPLAGPTVLLAALLANATCERRTMQLSHDGAVADDGATTGGVDGGDGSRNRVPQNHRSAAETCVAERGTLPVPDSCLADSGSQFTRCLSDSDCRAGSNGRCSARPTTCITNCSYDSCSADSDCGVHVPCHCRTSPTDFSNSWCVSGSNCAIDSDCGPGGYCSPSLVGILGGCTGCGTGYFCHTASDRCVDDADCTSRNSTTCAYNVPSGSWTCAEVTPYP
jgi:hypothetical protein